MRNTIEQLKKGETITFSWVCQTHGCWTLPIPPEMTPSTDNVHFCPGDQVDIDESNVDEFRNTGHLLQVKWRQKLGYPGKLTNRDGVDPDQLFYAAQIDHNDPFEDDEWQALRNLILGSDDGVSEVR